LARPARADDTRQRLDGDLRAIGVAMVAQVLVERADSVRAHLHLGSVGVPDLHAEVRARARPHHEQLVRADSEVAIAQTGRERLDRRQRVAHAVEHDEVVAGAVHLGEAKLGHGWSRLGSFESLAGSSAPGVAVGAGAAAGAAVPPWVAVSLRTGGP